MNKLLVISMILSITLLGCTKNLQLQNPKKNDKQPQTNGEIVEVMYVEENELNK